MTLPNYESRGYQEKIFQQCLKQNSIIYLPTGSGKTIIAIKVVNQFREELLKPISEGGRRSLFLTNTVCLAQQQSEVIEEVLGLKVACWTSETKKKSWSKEKCREEFNKHAVIVATAQLLVDAVKHSFVSIAQLNVIIFDECHHGKGQHPYHEFMKQFRHVEPAFHPRVICLSGMLVGVANTLTVDTVNDELKALESTYQAKIVTVNKIKEYVNVLLYSTNPNENFARYPKYANCDLAAELLQRIDQIRWDLGKVKVHGMTEVNPQSLRQRKSRKLKELELYFDEVKVGLEQMGLFGAYLGLKATRVQYSLIKKKPEQKREFLDVVNKCIEYVDELSDLLNAERDFENLSRKKILENVSPKVRLLILLLKKIFNEPGRVKDLQCLLFVTRRFTAKCLYHLLKRYAEHDRELPIAPDFIVGINGEIPESIDDILSLNSNSFALERFRNKKTNLLCSSSVLEEGIDLQMCNLVIMFDQPTTFRCYIQTMGRARVRNSNYIVLLEETQVDKFLRARDNMHEIDKKLKQILITTKAIDRELSAEDIEKEQAEAWEPLITEEKALVNSISSISLLNRFVSRYANANLLWARKDHGPGEVTAILTLPSALNIDTRIIESDKFADIKTAKRHAAFLACEVLYERGYLNSHLIPSHVP